jgi:tetraacyldisaccharide 4'-kinase
VSPERIWYGKDAGAALVRAALTPLSALYWVGWQTYLGIYHLGLKKAKEPHKPVICVGNMTAGGSGKSPTTIFVAQTLLELGREIAISASGYGSPAAEGASVAPDGELQASRWGDEPAMIRWLLPEAPLIVGRNRVDAARLCQQHFPTAVLLMDDGLQHMPLKKHVTIALEDEGPNQFVLPAGPYREPRSNLSRIDLAVGTGYRFQLVSIDGKLWSPDGAELLGQHVAVLCSIAKPTRFVDATRQRGLTVAAQKLMPDHDPLTAGNLFDGLLPELPLIVTTKDWVKLRERQDIESRTIFVAQREVLISPVDDFKDWLKSKLDEQA